MDEKKERLPEVDLDGRKPLPKQNQGGGDPVEGAMEEFQRAWFSGQRPDPDAFCGNHPEIAAELRKEIEDFLFVAKRLHVSDPAAKDGLAEETRDEASRAGKILGDFRIIREIGKGGMGTVYEAEQISLRRKVALKVLPSHLSFSDEAVHKFRREAEAGGRQHHPGIVAIHAVGEYEGVHFIAQEYVEGGRNLANKLDALRKVDAQPPGYSREAAELVAEVAEALQHAHDSGVIHRDVKPSNILITDEGQPKVTDFGLAKIEDALALSRTGDFAGTPFYMSPEQVASKRIGIDNRTDVFSLGVTLYEMLTLVRPFDGRTTQEVLKKILLHDPTDPRKVNNRIPRDLALVCFKAMEKDPNRRYQTMKDFVDDLRRFLSGEVVLAKPAGLQVRLWKMVKRHPALSAAAGVSALAIGIFLLVVPWILTLKERERYEEIMRLSDSIILSNLLIRAEKLWPTYPELIPEMETWIDLAENLHGNLDLHKKTLSALKEKAKPYDEETRQFDRETHPRWDDLVLLERDKNTLERQMDSIMEGGDESDSEVAETKGDTPDLDALMKQHSDIDEKLAAFYKEVSKRRTWKYDDLETQWQHDFLQELVSGIEMIYEEDTGTLVDVKDRLSFAKTIQKRSIDEYKRDWDRAISSIANRQRCPHYGELTIEHQIGFVPIGRDPASGLWEFVHLQTGTIPERGLDGKLEITEETGLVFVLIPGGTFDMGAEPPSGKWSLGDPNIDPDAKPEERPVHSVTIKPFLLSKYEMNQGQWLRFTKEKPSQYHSGPLPGGKNYTLLQPVEQVSWEDCVEVLHRLNLRLPSESEWEYAARGGTYSPWWTGDDKRTLDGAVNISDLCYHKYVESQPWWPYEDWLDDGYTTHAPVDHYRANPLGLHSMLGNVWEWCQDYYASYDVTPTDGSAHESWSSKQKRVCRGGGWVEKAVNCRSACRVFRDPGYRDANLGVRPAASLSGMN